MYTDRTGTRSVLWAGSPSDNTDSALFFWLQSYGLVLLMKLVLLLELVQNPVLKGTRLLIEIK